MIGCEIRWQRTAFADFFLMQCWFRKKGCATDMWTRGGPDIHTIVLQRGEVEVLYPDGEKATYRPGQIVPAHVEGTMTVTALEKDTEWLCFHTQKLFGKAEAPYRELISLDADQVFALPLSEEKGIVACVQGAGFIGENGFRPVRASVVAPGAQAEIEGYREDSMWLYIGAPDLAKRSA